MRNYTPLIPADKVSEHLLLKIEYMNPSLSVKHRSLPELLLKYHRDGIISKKSTLVIMTSGCAGISIAWIAKKIGCSALLLMPEGSHGVCAKYAEWMGAQIRCASPLTLMQELEKYRNDDNFFVIDQLKNSDTVVFYKKIGEELLPHSISAVVVPAGTCASVMGIAEFFQPYRIPVYAVEPSESAVLSGEDWHPHNIPGLAPPSCSHLFKRDIVAGILKVSSETAWDNAHEVMIKYGEPVGPSSGAAISGARRLREQGISGNIVAICSSHMITAL